MRKKAIFTLTLSSFFIPLLSRTSLFNPDNFKDFKIPVEVVLPKTMASDIALTFRPDINLSGIDVEKTETEFRNIVNAFINPKNSLRYSGIIGLGILIGLTSRYATTLMWEAITQAVLTPKPEILLPGTKYGRWDRLSRWWYGYEPPKMIFTEATKKELISVIETTRYTRLHNKKNKKAKIAYDNVLLQGKPGTGKTLFAKILADETDMDFVAVTAASLLQSGIAGVKYFNKLMRMARRSRYGLIIFIDEADALFVDRDSLNPDSDHYKILSHILALTGEGSDKFMLAAATNHAQVMDNAMSRRFQIRIDMPLPDTKTRKDLIHLYLKSELFNDKKNSKEFTTRACMLFTEQMINTITKQTDGLSHAEIKDIIQAIRKKGLASFDGILTLEHIQETVANAVKKHAAFENDKNKDCKKI